VVVVLGHLWEAEFGVVDPGSFCGGRNLLTSVERRVGDQDLGIGFEQIQQTVEKDLRVGEILQDTGDDDCIVRGFLNDRLENVTVDQLQSLDLSEGLGASFQFRPVAVDADRRRPKFSGKKSGHPSRAAAEVEDVGVSGLFSEVADQPVGRGRSTSPFKGVGIVGRHPGQALQGLGRQNTTLSPPDLQV